MDIRVLSYILEIAQQKSITRAAETLFVSQSSLSQCLSKLEQELGTPLFLRKKNELVLTNAGHLYVEAAKSVTQIQKQLYKSIANLSQSGSIRIGVSTQWGIQLITDAVPAMKNRFPKVRVEILEDRYVQLKKQLAGGLLDMALLAISDLAEHPGQLAATSREEILFAVHTAHHYCQRYPDAGTIHMEALREVFGQESFIMPSTGSTLKSLVDQRFGEQQFAPNALCEINRNSSIQYMVSKGVGVALMPACYRHDVPGIRYFSLTPPLWRYNVLVYRGSLEPAEADLYLTKLISDSPIFRSAPEWFPSPVPEARAEG